MYFTRDLFNKETTSVLYKLGSYILTSSHKFEFNKSLQKFQLQTSNLSLQWYFIEFNFYELNLSNLHKQFYKAVCSFSTLELWNFYFVILMQISVISNLLNENCLFPLLCNFLGHIKPFSGVSNMAVIMLMSQP